MKTLQIRVSDGLRSNADAVLEDIGLEATQKKMDAVANAWRRTKS